VDLPERFLQIAEYGDAHTAQSELQVRMQYVKKNRVRYEKCPDEAKLLLRPALSGELNRREIRDLSEMSLFTDAELLDISLACLDEREYRAGLAELQSLRSHSSAIEAGTNDVHHGGSVYLNVSGRHMIVSTTTAVNQGRDVIVTYLTDETHGRSEVIPNIVPFVSERYCPVSDGERYVYFFQRWDLEKGNKFGRLDCTNFTFEPLPALDGRRFDLTFRGCFHHGVIYAIDSKHELVAYIVAQRKWIPTEISLASLAINQYGDIWLMNFEHDVKHIYAMGYGDASQRTKGLFSIDVEKKTPPEFISEPGIGCGVHLYERLLVPVSKTEFIVVAALSGGSWHMFNSRKMAWTPLENWKSTLDDGVHRDHFHNHIVFVRETRSFYYHIPGQSTWEVVQLP